MTKFYAEFPNFKFIGLGPPFPGAYRQGCIWGEVGGLNPSVQNLDLHAENLFITCCGGSISPTPNNLADIINNVKRTTEIFQKFPGEKTPFMWRARVYKLLFVICLTEDVRSVAPSLQLHRYGDREK